MVDDKFYTETRELLKCELFYKLDEIKNLYGNNTNNDF